MAKKKAAKAPAKKAPELEMVVVGSKVKAYIKSQDAMTSGELLGALNVEVHGLLDKAIARAKANKRSTVKTTDL